MNFTFEEYKLKCIGMIDWLLLNVYQAVIQLYSGREHIQ